MTCVPAQCLAAGSIIMNREIESIAMRPLAKDLTRSLEEVRNITRDQALRDLNSYTDRMKDALRHFDGLFAEFELRCVVLQNFSSHSGNSSSISLTPRIAHHIIIAIKMLVYKI